MPSKMSFRLAILLVSAAVSMQASATFTALPTGNLGCTGTTAQFGKLTCGQFSDVANDAQLGQTPNGLEGLKFWLTGNLLDSENPGTYATVLAFSSSGLASGSNEAAGIAIPFTFDFTLGTSKAGTLTGYSLVFDIKQGSTSIFSSAPTFSHALSGNNATITGGSPFLTNQGIISGDSYTITAVLTVNWTTGAGTSGLTIGVPPNSFDVNSTSFVAPEPSTFGMLSVGLLGGAAFLRRRAQKT